MVSTQDVFHWENQCYSDWLAIVLAGTINFLLATRVTPSKKKQLAHQRPHLEVSVERSLKMSKIQQIDEEMENEYMCSRWVKDMPQNLVISTYKKQWAELSCQARESFDVELDIPYGKKEECKLDIYRTKETPQNAAPVLIFFHGGYWQECSKDIHAMAVFPAMRAASIAVMVGYQLAPKASLDEIVAQVKSAVEFVGKRFHESKLYLCGHSAGAHLAAMMMIQESWEDPNLPTRVQGILLISGIFDLMPILKTSVNTAVKINEEDAKRNSPAIRLKSLSPSLRCPVMFAVGELESPSFHNQSKNLLELLKTHGTDCIFLDLSQCHHFSIISKLADPEFHLSKNLCKMLTGQIG